MKLPRFLFYDILAHADVETKYVSSVMATGLTVDRHVELKKIVPALKMNAFTYIVQRKFTHSSVTEYFDEVARMKDIIGGLSFGSWWSAFIYSEITSSDAIFFGAFMEESDAVYFRMATA